MAVADPEEGFFLELVPGGKWVAKRVADDEVDVLTNGAVLVVENPDAVGEHTGQIILGQTQL